MPLVLRVEGPGTIRYRGSDLPELIEIDDRLTVGRDEKNDLVLSDEQRGISTEHCRIERIDRGYTVSDRSRNGTFLNELRIDNATANKSGTGRPPTAARAAAQHVA